MVQTYYRVQEGCGSLEAGGRGDAATQTDEETEDNR